VYFEGYIPLLLQSLERQLSHKLALDANGHHLQLSKPCLQYAHHADEMRLKVCYKIQSITGKLSLTCTVFLDFPDRFIIVRQCHTKPGTVDYSRPCHL